MKAQKLSSKTPIVYASFLSRFMAFTTDLFMIGIPISIFAMIFIGYENVNSAGAMDVFLETQKAKDNAPTPIASIAQLLLSALVYILFWHKKMQTPGKKMAGIKVVDKHTLQSASYLKLTIRFFSYFISFLFFGYLFIFFDKQKRGLHDIFAGTVVIYE